VREDYTLHFTKMVVLFCYIDFTNFFYRVDWPNWFASVTRLVVHVMTRGF